MNDKKMVKETIEHLKKVVGVHNTGILLAILSDHCDYALCEKGLKEVRCVEFIFNDLYRTVCDLQTFKETH